MKLHTTCNRDCPDACGLVAHVQDGRVVRLEGDPDHPVTQGFLCYRTRRFPATLQVDPARITRPLARATWLASRRGQPVDGADAHGFVEVSWDEALDHVAAALLRIRESSGPAAILNYRGGGSLGLLKHLVDHFFEQFGPCAVKRGDVCSGAGEAAQHADFGECNSHDLDDLRSSRHIVLWGKNPTVSNIHLVPHLVRARNRGASVTLIDPAHTKSTSFADAYIQPRPGGDLALALAVARLILERSAEPLDLDAWCEGVEGYRALVFGKPVSEWLADADVPLSEAEALADTLLDGPTAILVGWGMQRRSNGAATVRALSALGALSGSLGLPGGGCSFYFKRRGAFDVSFVRGDAPRTLSEPLLGQEILAATDPPIRAVWVNCANPVAMLPDSRAVSHALETRELVVVCDAFLTDTARRAHVVLPTTTLLEDDDIVGAYGHHYLGEVRPVVPPAGEARTDLQILQDLAPRVGLDGVLDRTPRQWKERLLRRVSARGASLADLERGPVRNPDAPQVLFAGRRFPTPSGRMRLMTTLPPPVDEADPGYDLFLLSNSTQQAQCSQWSADRRLHAGVATVHPETAARVGLGPGDPARLESPIGTMRVTVRTDALQRRDVVILPKGGWLDEGTCANALVPARLTDQGEGAAYLDARVRLLPIG
jgi:anaerobic selenocysteine-containing dehydrogenase